MKKVLIVYATGGMGHVTAAKAVEQAFASYHEYVDVKCVDVIEFANPIYKKVFVDGYNWISAKKPEFWGWLYKTYNSKSKQSLPSILSRLAISKRFIPFVRKYNPDFIVSTHPLPMILISYSKAHDVINKLSSLVVTDFGCHSFWVDPEVNYYFTATEEVGMCLQGYGVKQEQVVVNGIPIHPKFSEKLDKNRICEKIGLDKNLPTILIVGGQFSYEVLIKIITGVKKVHKDNVQFIIVAGRDKYLKEALDKTDFDGTKNIKVFGFVDNMHELMAVSNLIFSKAGGLTVSECMAMQLPMVINKVIPGQEEDNVTYLVSKNAAIKVNGFEEIVTTVNDLLSRPEKLAKMKQACAQIGRPNSAKTLADFVVERIK